VVNAVGGASGVSGVREETGSGATAASRHGSWTITIDGDGT
jgi:hypothetical protein